MSGIFGKIKQRFRQITGKMDQYQEAITFAEAGETEYARELIQEAKVKEESVKTIQKECMDMLDLSFDESDLDEIVKDGAASLDREYADGVIESLDLFAAILGYSPPPKAFKIGHHNIIGALTKKESGEIIFGPMVIYSIIHNTLKLIDQQIGSFNKEKMEFVHQVVSGKEKADAEGPDVFKYLKEAVGKLKV